MPTRRLLNRRVPWPGMFLLLMLALASSLLGDLASDFQDGLLAAHDALAAGRVGEAETLYRELIAADPQQVAPYQGLAEVFVARGRPDEGVALILRVARKLIPSKRYGEAIAPLELAVSLAPELPEVQVLLGRALAEERQYSSAAAVYQRAVELGAADLETLLYLGASYWESEQYIVAEETYERALAQHDNALAAYHLGQFLLWQGRAHEAVVHLERAVVERGERAGVWFHLARARAESGDGGGARTAYERVLELDPEHEKARQALNLLRQRGGSDNLGLASPAPEVDGGPVVRFTSVAESAGIHFRHHPGVTERRHLPESMGSGLAWFDYDGDGWWDLYLVQSGPFPPDGSAAAANRLFRNRGVGADGRITFEDVTARAGAGERSYGQGVVAADIDGDGDTDLYLTNYGSDVLLENRGDGSFEDRTVELGLAGIDGWSSSAALADADGDGDLDLYVSRYVEYNPAHEHLCGTADRPDYCNVILFSGLGDRFYRNHINSDGVVGGMRFVEETEEAGFGSSTGRGLGVVWTDLDGDHRPDLYVVNDLDPNRLYRNLGGDGRLLFEDVSLLSGAAFNREGEAEAGMGVVAGDVDGDGLPELAVTNFDVETNTLYHNLGGLAFTDISAPSGFGLPSFNLLGFGIALADFDGDGDLDAYVANGHVFERPRREAMGHAQADLLLLGDGHRRFRAHRLSGKPKIGRGVAVADYDSDGDPDVAVQNNRAAPDLLRNDGTGGAGFHWLGVVLQGGGRNTQAVGARVKLVTGRPGAEEGARRVQFRQVMAGQSYQSSSDRRLLFAWPTGEEALELEVLWPAGRVTRLLQPPMGRYLHLGEPW